MDNITDNPEPIQWWYIKKEINGLKRFYFNNVDQWSKFWNVEDCNIPPANFFEHNLNKAATYLPLHSCNLTKVYVPTGWHIISAANNPLTDIKFESPNDIKELDIAKTLVNINDLTLLPNLVTLKVSPKYSLQKYLGKVKIYI
jgi:hypothetical protein